MVLLQAIIDYGYIYYKKSLYYRKSITKIMCDLLVQKQL